MYSLSFGMIAIVEETQIGLLVDLSPQEEVDPLTDVLRLLLLVNSVGSFSEWLLMHLVGR